MPAVATPTFQVASCVLVGEIVPKVRFPAIPNVCNKRFGWRKCHQCFFTVATQYTLQHIIFDHIQHGVTSVGRHVGLVASSVHHTIVNVKCALFTFTMVTAENLERQVPWQISFASQDGWVKVDNAHSIAYCIMNSVLYVCQRHKTCIIP